MPRLEPLTRDERVAAAILCCEGNHIKPIGERETRLLARIEKRREQTTIWNIRNNTAQKSTDLLVA